MIRLRKNNSRTLQVHFYRLKVEKQIGLKTLFMLNGL